MMSKRPVPLRGSLRRRRQPISLSVEPMEPRLLLAIVVTVNNTGDTGAGTLREAIDTVNNKKADTILFKIEGSGVQTISPATPLPPITQPVTIDGYSQPGASPNTKIVGDNAQIMIVLDGSGISSTTDGLVIAGGSSTVMGLSIVGFSNDGIHLTGQDGDTISGNFIGILPDGTEASVNRLNGVDVDQVSSNTIGGPTPAARNIISNNGDNGVRVFGGARGFNSTDNTISGNYIGTDPTGTASLFNYNSGILLDRTQDNTIGGVNDLIVTAAGIDSSSKTFAGNLVSGNDFAGILIKSIFDESQGNVIEGNLVGTDATGVNPLIVNPADDSTNNLDGGILIDGSPFDTTIGGTTAGARNVISGNIGPGITVRHESTEQGGPHKVVIQGNYIGLNINGDSPQDIGNHNSFSVAGDGILIDGEYQVQVGGESLEMANYIANNSGSGVVIRNTQLQDDQATFNNIVTGNFIGTDLTGMIAQGNGGDGIDVENAGTNLIGTGTADVFESDLEGYTSVTFALPNVISANGRDGVHIAGTSSSGNMIQGNLIGTDMNGSIALGNQGLGVVIDNAPSNIIGGVSGFGNVISANQKGGVQVTGGGAIKNQVLGNKIGTDNAGNSALPNQLFGVLVDTSADGNTIGGTVSGAGNIISGNVGPGITFISAGAAGGLSNSIQDNIIGLSADGSKSLDMQTEGVLVTNSQGTTIGGTTAGARNVISGNTQNGIHISGGTIGNQIVGNLIGTDPTGLKALGNQMDGILLDNAASNVLIGGTAAGSRNIIAGNLGVGIALETNTLKNKVQGNTIGLDISGSKGLGNGLEGVLIDSAVGNTIGGTDTGAGNIISANGVVSALNGFGVRITGATAAQNLISNDLIGTDAGGTLAGLGNLAGGVQIEAGASANTISGSTNTISGSTISGSTISGNSHFGVHLTGVGTTLNVVQGNTIGLDSSGKVALANSGTGVTIDDGAQFNTIGSGNVIAGNTLDGVLISGTPTASNSVQNNFIGFVVVGSGLKTGNQQIGVEINQGAAANSITGNTISDNGMGGVAISGESGVNTSGNLVAGNMIGTDPDGTMPEANQVFGVRISSDPGGTGTASANSIGAASGRVQGRNIISGNDQVGVLLAGAGVVDNVVANNWIGLDSTGLNPLANTGAGVRIHSAVQNTIGGTTRGTGNVIAGNTSDGIDLTGPASNNFVGLNLIGTDTSGKAALPNKGAGIKIENGALGNAIGDANAGNTIAGNAGAGVNLFGAGTNGNTVAANLIGLGEGGGKLANNGGVVVDQGAAANTIGGTSAGDRNTISGNTGAGVAIIGGASGTVVLGNYIGTDLAGGGPAAGANPASNTGDGIFISSAGNFIGIDSNLSIIAANVVSGNDQNGIRLSTPTATENIVAGNDVGTNSSVTAKVPNLGDGILLDAGASFNSIGGQAAGGQNIVSGNIGNGIHLTGAGTSANVLQANLIGIIPGASPTARAKPLPNLVGVLVDHGAQDNQIGAAVAGLTNVISGNTGPGVVIDGADATGTIVQGNLIGLDPTGTFALSNGGSGVSLKGASHAMIGGSTAAAQNIIAGNVGDGILANAGAAANLIAGNIIGTNLNNSLSLGNQDGILLDGVGTMTIGGTTAALGNIISGNKHHGIELVNTATGNLVSGNFIGTDTTGTGRVGNTLDGILIHDGASGNWIGGQPDAGGSIIAASRNVISNNGGQGIEITRTLNPNTMTRAADASGNLIFGNFIGTDASGAADRGNVGDGVLIVAASGNMIGGPNPNGPGGLAQLGFGNLIAANKANGIELSSGASGNQVLGDLIGLGIGGQPLPNQRDGVLIVDTPANTIGAVVDPTSTISARNVISGNKGAGVHVTGASASGTSILGNFIGVNPAGSSPVGNGIGILIDQGATAVLIGGLSAGPIQPGRSLSGPGNLISGNVGPGIRLDSGAVGNVMSGNLIGTDLTASIPLGNSGAGIELAALAGGKNTIGGTAVGAGNVIAGNFADGILDLGSQPGNAILGNQIGFAGSTARALPNGGNGVNLQGGSIIVGGLTAGARNAIAGNTGAGVRIGLATATGNLVVGNDIGFITVGAPGAGASYTALPNTGGGVKIESRASHNTIGPGNVIAGNIQDGLTSVIATDNVITGNTIGLDPSGNPLKNQGNGVSIRGGWGTIIGGTTPGAGNVISANGFQGVVLQDGSIGTLIAGNIIGLDPTATRAVGNASSGILVNGSSDNTIGGPGAARNTISGNSQTGIQLIGASSDNTISTNTIGTDAQGLDLGNGLDGINLTAGPNAGPRQNTIVLNLIAGNQGSGIALANPNTSLNTIQTNVIGFFNDPTTGLPAVLANQADGITIINATANTIGNTAGSLDRGNWIGGNGRSGIQIVGTAAAGNLVAGNKVGTDLNGLIALPNQKDGVTLDLGALANTIGGSVAGARNLIAGNRGNGVSVLDGAVFNLVAGNWIGLDAGGVKPLPNAADGVRIDTAGANLVGTGTLDGLGGNVISGNGASGIRISGKFTLGSGANQQVIGNLVQSNLIGLDPTGTSSGAGDFLTGGRLGNRLDGIFLDNAPGNTLGGPANAGNIIAGNAQFGIDVLGNGADSTGEMIQNNIIGLDRSGRGPADPNLGNTDGIELSLAGQNTIVGNTISNNNGIGINVYSQPGRNVIVGNMIGVDSSGLSARGNLKAGIFIDDSPGNTIGGVTDDYRNVIASSIGNPTGVPNGAPTTSFPSPSGIQVFGTEAVGNRIFHNYIGTDTTGQHVNDSIGRSFGNTVGIFLNNAGVPHTVDPQGNIFPDMDHLSPDLQNQVVGNLVSGNYEAGVELIGDGAYGNLIAANRIGTDSTGMTSLIRADDGSNPNTFGGFQNAGVLLNNAPGNIIGDRAATNPTLLSAGDLDGRAPTPGRITLPGNLISGNLTGVEVFGIGGRFEVIAGNLIGTDRTGTLAAPNLYTGVFINNAGAVTPQGSGGPTSSQVNPTLTPNQIKANLISGNGYTGIQIFNQLSQFNTVANNIIGPDINQAAAPRMAPANPNQVLGRYMTPTAINTYSYPIDPTLGAANQMTNRTGVFIDNSSHNTVIQNNISNNGRVGVYIADALATGNLVTSNKLWTEYYGILLYNTPNNLNQVDPQSGSGAPNSFANNAQTIRPFTGPTPADTFDSKFPPLPGTAVTQSQTVTTGGTTNGNPIRRGTNPFANRRLAFANLSRSRLGSAARSRPRG